MNASIESFNQYGSGFWDKKGPYRTLHHINPARLKFMENYIHFAGARILDIGCGGGILAEAMAKKGAQVSAIDLSPTVITAAKEHLATTPLHVDYRLISSHDCVQNHEQYDHISCMEMLEHVPNPGLILRDIEAMLRPGGYAFLSTLNRNLKSLLTAKFAAEYLVKLVPKGTHDPEWFIKPEELAAMAKHAGLRPVAFSGMDYHPFLKTAVLSRDCSVNYLFAVQKPQR